MDYKIEFYYNRNLDPVFIHKFFYFLVSRGVKYNAGKYRGAYFIFAKEPEKDIEHEEIEINESTEKLAEIIDTYVNFNLKTTSFNIWLDYVGEVKFFFNVGILQVKDNKSLISFGAGKHLVSDEKTFLAFVNLCKEVFVKFNFLYASYRDENQADIPSDVVTFLAEKPNIVNFYSKPLVDRIGREKLLSTPAFKVEELENGGIMLIVCTEPLGCDNIYEVWRHLSYG